LKSTYLACALAVAGCSSGGVKTTHVSSAGKAAGLQRSGDDVAYILDISSGLGGAGELHITNSTGVDKKIATGISAAAFGFAPDGKHLLYVQANSGNMDASLNWVDVTTGDQKVVFAHGMALTANNPNSMTATGSHAAPLLAQGVFTASGKYFVCGVLPPTVAASADLHAVDLSNGNDVFSASGAWSYNFLLSLPSDLLVFQNAKNTTMGATGPAPLEQLYWIDLTAPSGTGTAIDARVVNFGSTPDNKTVVYQRTDLTLWAWDPASHPAAGTMIASDAVQFTIANGLVVYSSSNGDVHLIGTDGTKKTDVTGAMADLHSSLYLSSDDGDVFYFQNMEIQASRGTLMHVGSGGGTPTKIDDKVSISDVRPVPSGLLYLRNVDDKGTTGDLVKAGKDGSGGAALGTGVPIGTLLVNVSGSDWQSPHLVSGMPDPMQILVDATTATTGGLEIVTSKGVSQKVESATRFGAFRLSDDEGTLLWLGGLAYNATADNYVGTFKLVDLSMAAAMPTTVPLMAVSELTPVSKRSVFIDVTDANGPPGVYYVTY
jgi:hypothetical protein